MKKNTLMYFYGLLFGGIFFLDRISKYMMRNVDQKYEITDFLSFTLHYNRGISWGMLHSENHVIFTTITCVIGLFIAAFMVYTVIRYLNHRSIVGEVMVLAGALSNLIDRLLYGGVADFILFSHGAWSFPIFNVADIFIVSGLCLIVIGEYLYGDK